MENVRKESIALVNSFASPSAMAWTHKLGSGKMSADRFADLVDGPDSVVEYVGEMDQLHHEWTRHRLIISKTSIT